MGISTTPALHQGSSLDVVGASTSLVCAVHCVVVSLFLGGLPAASFLAAPWIEWAFLGASTVIGLVTLVPGHARHRMLTPIVLFVVGISILVATRVMYLAPPAVELSLVAVAAVCLISAHWRNRGALHSCACGPQHH